MRKTTLLIALAALLIGAYFLFTNFKKKETEPVKPEKAIEINSPDTTMANLSTALNDYYALKDALVGSDAAAASAKAGQLQSSLSKIYPASSMDPSIIDLVTNLKNTAIGNAEKIANSNGLEESRIAFQPLSDGLYDMLRSLNFSEGKVYQQFCPMAFDNKGANWLSNKEEIMNPYFGDKMLHCGEIKDSIANN